MADPSKKFERDEELLELLYRKYAKDGIRIASWRQTLRFRVKTFLWIVVTRGSLKLKRLIDIVGSIIGLVLLSPVFGTLYLAIRLEDGSPVFFSQERIGKFGVPFRMYKFRSMIKNAESMRDDLEELNETGGIIFKIKRDPRITRVGHFMRRYSLDELPQLYNVLKGDMSLVGPRPHPTTDVSKYSLEHRRRLDITPGLTCFWQVSGRSEIGFEKQVDLDMQYIESQSLWLDIILLLKTIPAVIFGRGAY
ncbi:MAG: sugar transferase [Desulfomonilaceae bacterium]